ncbi:MAG: MFS transporter [Candidatus Thorarchaeota archaeon]
MTEAKGDLEAERTGKIEEIEEKQPIHLSWRESLGRVFQNRNFKIFLATAWIYSSMQVTNRYFTLYFRDIGVSYVAVGMLFSAMTIVALGGTFIAGYLADNYDRKRLAYVTMGINALGFLILSAAIDLWMVAFGLLTLAASNFTGQGGTAYIMEVIDRRHGGVAVSLFTLGTLLGLVPLLVVSIMLDARWVFVDVMRVMFFASGVLYIACTIIRMIWLDATPVPVRERSGSILRDVISENLRGLKLLVRVFPIFIAVMILDALSDSFYGFSNLYYVNETLNFGIGDINLMLLLTLIISVPLTLYLGSVFDKRGGKRLTIGVYSVMPIAITLLIIAQIFPYLAPLEWVNALNSVYPGLGVIFSLAFIATAIKSINDVLWMSVIRTYIQKSLPRKELGKMLGLTTVLIILTGTVAPILSGIIYQLYQGVPLLVMALILNIFILAVLVTKSIEPRISVEELENGDEAV